MEHTEPIPNTGKPYYNPKRLNTNVTYVIIVGEEEVKIERTVGVKQGENLGPIIFIILIQAVSTTLVKNLNFATLNFRRYALKKNGDFRYLPKSKKESIKSIKRYFFLLLEILLC